MRIEDLVFDVGMHRGEDTAYYLAKGYRVVAFEANPDLADRGRARFAREIAGGRVQIVEGAIADSTDSTVTFHRHPANTVWGTTDSAWAERNAHLGGSVPIEVPVVRFGDVLREQGTPWYLKIDIEGVDRLCLEALLELPERPAFVSIESEKQDWDALLGEFDLLRRLGFDRFAVRQQKGVGWRPRKITTRDGRRIDYRFEEGSSGPFGDDIDGWVGWDEALQRYRSIFRRYRLLGDGTFLGRGLRWQLLKALERASRRPLPGWYDTHATSSSVIGG